MSERELIEFLWRHGHFWSQPAGVTEADLPKLTLRDAAVKSAVRSFQAADANLIPLAGAFHGRPPDIDGEAGPATLAMAALPRCPVPDHPPPVGVRSADPILNGIIRSMQEWAAGGSGSWPAAGCDPERRGVHSIRVGLNTSRVPSGVKAYLAQALAASTACYAEMGIAVRYVLDTAGPAEIVKRFESLSGSVIGWNEFPRGGSCSAINGRLDTGYVPGDWRMFANLEVHETGHGVGLQHTRGHIMNPSILLIWPLTWKGGPSESTMRRYFGGEPVGGPTPVPPAPFPPDPPPVGPPVPVPTQGKITLNLDTRTVTLPPGWKQG